MERNATSMKFFLVLTEKQVVGYRSTGHGNVMRSPPPGNSFMTFGELHLLPH